MAHWRNEIRIRSTRKSKSNAVTVLPPTVVLVPRLSPIRFDMPSRMSSTIQFLYKLKHLFDKTWVEVTKLMCHIISCHLSLNMWTYQEPWVSLMSCQDIKQIVNLSFFGLYQKHRWTIIWISFDTCLKAVQLVKSCFQRCSHECHV